MASGPITSWQIDGEILNITNHQRNGNQTETRYQEIVAANCDYSHEIKRHLLLGRKAMTNLDGIKKQRHHFAYKGSSSQSYGFSSSHV